MNGLQILTDYWQVNIFAIVIALLLIIFHVISNGSRLTGKSALFFTGIFLFLLVTLSPISYLAHYYLFSAHMAEHIIVLLIVPPLLLAGTDASFLEKISQKKYLKIAGNVLFKPPVAWFFGVGSMWVMHIPGIYHAMKQSLLLMNIQTFLLLIFGVIFIWPVFAPVQWRKLMPLGSVVYLFTACVGCTILGIIITFMPIDLFTSRMIGHDPALWYLIQHNWQITPDADQQIGGLLMWVPACFVYVTYIMITLFKWYLTADAEDTVVKVGN